MIKKLTFKRLTHAKYLIVLSIILFAALILVAVSILTENTNNHTDNQLLCRLAGNSCKVVLPEGPLIVTMDRLPTVEEQIPLTLTLPDPLEISGAYVEGVNMFMGKIPVPLEQNDKQQWQGWFMLGACSQPSMQWRMVVSIKNRPAPVWILFTTQM